VTGGASRFDVQQGELGESLFLHRPFLYVLQIVLEKMLLFQMTVSCIVVLNKFGYYMCNTLLCDCILSSKLNTQFSLAFYFKYLYDIFSDLLFF